MSGKSCVIAFEDSNLSKQLRKRVGKDDKKFIAYQTAIINPNDATQFDEAFTNAPDGFDTITNILLPSLNVLSVFKNFINISPA